MKVKKIELGWVTVSSSEKAKQFFTKLGLELRSEAPDCGWLELQGHDGGAFLGVSQVGPYTKKAGNNAVMTFTVENIVTAKKELESQNVRFDGDIMEVPGHVKLATFFDEDGNEFQLVETLDQQPTTSSCC